MKTFLLLVIATALIGCRAPAPVAVVPAHDQPVDQCVRQQVFASCMVAPPADAGPSFVHACSDVSKEMAQRDIGDIYPHCLKAHE